MNLIHDILTKTTIPFGRVVERKRDARKPNLQPLSVYLDVGVVPRSSRDDNYNRLGADLGGYLVVEPGDIVFNKLRTWQGGLGMSKFHGIVSPAYFVCRPSPEFESRFLHYLLRSAPYLAEFTRISKFMPPSQFDILWDELRLVPIPLLALSRQRAIADFLDTETARIDALITKKRRLIDLLDDRDSTVVEEVLTKEAVHEIPLRRLLLIPPAYGASESGAEGEEGWPRYIRITDLTNGGKLHDERLVRLSPDIAHPYMLTDGDILLARSGATVGKAFLYRKEMGAAAFAGYLIRFRVNRGRALPEVLAAWTRTGHYWSQVRLASLQATIENVSAEKFKDFRVPVPPLSRQSDVAGLIQCHLRRSRSLRRLLTSQITLLQEHRQALITAAVTGEIEVPGAA